MTAAKEMESMRTIGKYQNPGGAAVLCVESSLAQGSCFNVSVMNCPRFYVQCLFNEHKLTTLSGPTVGLTKPM